MTVANVRAVFVMT